MGTHVLLLKDGTLTAESSEERHGGRRAKALRWAGYGQTLNGQVALQR